MSLDKFGRRSEAFKRRQQFSIPYSKPALPHTQDGNIDVEHLKICNLNLPTEKSDAATKDYVDSQLKENFDVLNKKMDEINQNFIESVSKSNLAKDNQIKIGLLKSKNELLENDIKYKLLPKIAALEDQHKLFNITANYISIGNKRIVKASRAINEFDLVPKGQLVEIIDEKLKDFEKNQKKKTSTVKIK